MAAVGALGMGIDHWLKDLAPTDRRFAVTAVGTLVFHVVILALIHELIRDCGMSWTEAFGFKRGTNLRCASMGAAWGLVVLPLNIGLMWIAQKLMVSVSVEPVAQEAVRVLQQAPTNDRRIVLGFMAVVSAPIVEEIFFRGILFVWLRQAGFPKIAFLGTAALFAATHSNLATFLPLAFFGFILAWLYDKTDNLLTPIAAHALFNLINFTWLILAKQPI